MLKYSGVEDIDGFKPKFDGNLSISSVDYQLIFNTTPGNAIYEVSIYFLHLKKTYISFQIFTSKNLKIKIFILINFR